jgi:hypothetical protein
MGSNKVTNGNGKAKAPAVATAPAKAPKGKGKPTTAMPTTYADLAKQLDAPVAERKPIAIGRNGDKIVPRRFHIDADKLDALKKERAENPKAIPNPQNVGAYWLFIEALKSLGVNRAHPFKTVKAEMKKIGSAPETKDENDKTLWQRFAEKDGKSENEENCKSLDGRIHQNAEVLQRLGGFTPYGLKLLQVGQLVLKSKGLVIDVLKGKDGKEILYRLNPDSATPINETKRQRSAK